MAGLTATAGELARRGARAEIRHHGRGRRTIIAVSDRTMEITVRTKRVGDWQTDTRLGDAEPEQDGDRFWILVDLGEPQNRYFVAPEWWMLNDIHHHHERYLRQHGGRRARTPDSHHHRIPEDRVGQWQDRWDLLGL